MAVLVTGGAGFIGSHTVDLLVEEGTEVVVIDDLSSGKLENLEHTVPFYRLDVRSKEVERCFLEHEIDAVIHLAAQVSVESSLKEPQRDMEINLGGTLNLLELCRKHDVAKFVFASSVAVYGEPKYVPVDEQHELAPLAPYGCSKLASEFYLKLYSRLYGLQTVSLRYANVYGPRQRSDGEGGVIAIFARRALLGEPLVIYGDGNQTRDFVYVRDVARANLLALGRSVKSLGLNIATSKETSINQLVEILKQQLGKDLFKYYLKEFGFGSLTGIELPDEARGNIENLDKPGEIYLATASFGQGITATPLQVANFFLLVANRGKPVKWPSMVLF